MPEAQSSKHTGQGLSREDVEAIQAAIKPAADGDGDSKNETANNDRIRAIIAAMREVMEGIATKLSLEAPDDSDVSRSPGEKGDEFAWHKSNQGQLMLKAGRSPSRSSTLDAATRAVSYTLQGLAQDVSSLIDSREELDVAKESRSGGRADVESGRTTRAADEAKAELSDGGQETLDEDVLSAGPEIEAAGGGEDDFEEYTAEDIEEMEEALAVQTSELHCSLKAMRSDIAALEALQIWT
jgi:hypothetical protein